MNEIEGKIPEEAPECNQEVEDKKITEILAGDKKQEHREPDDKRLVALSQKGDKAAFEGLVRMYSKYVYTNAFFMLRDAHEAEDVSQEVFVKVYLSIKNFRGLSSFKTWLRKLTINTCIDKLRISKTADKKVSLEAFEENMILFLRTLTTTKERNHCKRNNKRSTGRDCQPGRKLQDTSHPAGFPGLQLQGNSNTYKKAYRDSKNEYT